MASYELLHHRKGLVRKSTAAVLQFPRRMRRLLANEEAYRANPPVLTNSFPKSGTHLLEQIVGSLPNQRLYGTFLASMTSSRQFRQLSVPEMRRKIWRITPHELVRGHIAFDPTYAHDLRSLNVVHYFIYRDPRDIVVSEAHYLRSANRWHRLHPIFRRLPSLDDAIALSIQGLNFRQRKIYYPDIAERFAAYEPWIDHPRVCSLKFEELRGPAIKESLVRMAEFYAQRLDYDVNTSRIAQQMECAIDPHRSHTFRSGKTRGWQSAFKAHHHDLFREVTGDLLLRLGYESKDRTTSKDDFASLAIK